MITFADLALQYLWVQYSIMGTNEDKRCALRRRLRSYGGD